MAKIWSDLSATDDIIKHLLTLMAKEMNVNASKKLSYKNYMSKLGLFKIHKVSDYV